jgi:VWFA-related protein
MKPIVIPVALAVAVLAALARPAAQQSGQRPTFRSSTELLLVDVRIVDRSGAPVSDLGASNFTVTVDRKPRPVVSAQFVNYEVRSDTVTDRKSVPSPQAPPPVEAPPPPSPRIVLIVVDEDSMQAGDGLLVKRETDRFLDKLQPRDLVGVAVIPRTASVVKMTRDRAAVRKELAAVSPGVTRQGYLLFFWIAEAFAVAEDKDVRIRDEVITRECGNGPGRGLRDCPKLALEQMTEMARDARLRGQQFVDAFLGLADSLQQVAGPKTMVLVTGGAPMPDRTSLQAMSRLAPAFAAAQISLYTLFIERPSYDGEKGRLPFRSDLDDRVVEQAGVENATSTVGGIFMTAVGTLDQYFDRVVREMAGYYLLGVEVDASDHDGRSHQVSVKVDRPAVDVRARKEYVIPKAGQSSAR